jgi:EmrB/QacA subfamily drug resistance transporter
MVNKNKKRISLLVLLLAHLLTIVDIFIVNVAIPSIQHGLGSTPADVQLVVAMYIIGFASFLIIGGKSGDHYGRKSVFLLGLFLFMLISAFCGFAETSEQLIVLRFFQGMSAGLMSPQVLSYIQALFKNHRERTSAIGWYGIAIGIGTMMGQFLGGFLVELKPLIAGQSWRYIFLINIPICAISIVLGGKYLDQSKDHSSLKMDYTSACILSIGLVMLVSALTVGLELGGHLLKIFLPTSLILLLWFGFRQKRRKEKRKQTLLDPELFKYRNFNMAVLAAALFMLMLDAYFFILAIFLQDGLRLTPLHAGYFIVFQGAGFILASLFSAGLILRFGKKVMIFGVIMIISALVLQLVLFRYDMMGLSGYAVMIVHGIGVALVLPSFANTALKGLPENIIGNASGVYSTLQQLFGALGIALTGGIFYFVLNGTKDPVHFYNAFVYATFIHLIFLTGVLTILVCLPKTILPQKSEQSIGADRANRPAHCHQHF